MPAWNLRRFDVQARLGFYLSLAALPPMFVAAFLAINRFRPDLGQIVYGSGGKFLPAYFGMLLASMLPALVGFALGLNSAGQRRNDASRQSWIGFFLGGAVLTIDVILVLAFMMLRFKLPT